MHTYSVLLILGNPATLEWMPDRSDRTIAMNDPDACQDKPSIDGTASAEEIARFTAMAESWWDENGKFRPLHQLNPPRISFIRRHIVSHFRLPTTSDTPLKGLDILDIGCGGGLMSEPMRQLGGKVTGIDAGEENIRIAKIHAEKSGLDIDYQCRLPETMAKEDTQFDVVLNMEVVEHVSDLPLFLEACAKMVKPGGIMFISTINRTLKSMALAKIGAEYILRWLPAGTHDWNKFVKPSELASGLRRNGMVITRLEGMSYDLFGDKWSLTTDLGVNYLALAVKE